MLTLITIKMKVIKRVRPRGKMFLNPSTKSVRALIKNKCIIRLAKQRSIIKSRKLDLAIKTCTGEKKLDSNNPNGLSINKRAVNYSGIPAKLHDLFKKSIKWIKFASHEKEVKPYTPAEPNILINRNVFVNWITYFIRLVSHSMKVKSFILDKPSVLINKSALENQVIYSRSKKYFFIPV